MAEIKSLANLMACKEDAQMAWIETNYPRWYGDMIYIGVITGDGPADRIAEMLEMGDDLDFPRVGRLDLSINGEKFFALFTGLILGQGGFDPELHGIYASKQAVKAELGRFSGYIQE